MHVHTFDPLADPRWPDFVERHPRASIFHTPGWLRALERTYGFQPVAFTTSPPAARLANALVFAAVRSRLTGRRLVSLPFSDHCDPLVENDDELRALCAAAGDEQRQVRWKYVELRPADSRLAIGAGFFPSETFALHRLDLRRDTAALMSGFHRDSIQRKIRRAEREGLTYAEGRSEALVRALRGLLDLTRRRHQAPLQSPKWFRNLIAGLGDRLCIRIASKGGRPVAGILTVMHRDRMVYKYGGSDAALNALGGVPWLFWKAIQDAKARGGVELDLGRSDTDNTGLIAFKEHLGATRQPLTYWRAPEAAVGGRDGTGMRMGRRLFAMLPGPLRRTAGTLLYPHLA
jgi:hypothetical protein